MINRIGNIINIRAKAQVVLIKIGGDFIPRKILQNGVERIIEFVIIINWAYLGGAILDGIEHSTGGLQRFTAMLQELEAVRS